MSTHLVDVAVDEALRTALAELPRTPEEIAALLVDRGHVGRRGDARDDALGAHLADAVSERLGRPVEILVSDLDASLLESGVLVHVVPLLPAVGAFVRRVDAGEWPALTKGSLALGA